MEGKLRLSEELHCRPTQVLTAALSLDPHRLMQQNFWNWQHCPLKEQLVSIRLSEKIGQWLLIFSQEPSPNVELLRSPGAGDGQSPATRQGPQQHGDGRQQALHLGVHEEGQHRRCYELPKPIRRVMYFLLLPNSQKLLAFTRIPGDLWSWIPKRTNMNKKKTITIWWPCKMNNPVFEPLGWSLNK